MIFEASLYKTVVLLVGLIGSFPDTLRSIYRLGIPQKYPAGVVLPVVLENFPFCAKMRVLVGFKFVCSLKRCLIDKAFGLANAPTEKWPSG